MSNQYDSRVVTIASGASQPIAGNFDWFYIERFLLTDARPVVSVGMRTGPNEPITAACDIPLGDVIESRFAELMFTNTAGYDIRFKLTRGLGRCRRRALDMFAGRSVVAARELWRAGTLGTGAYSGIGTGVICTALNNTKGLLVVGGSFTAHGDGANDGACTLVADNGATSWTVDGAWVDKSGGPVCIPMRSYEIPSGLALSAVRTSAKDRMIVTVVSL